VLKLEVIVVEIVVLVGPQFEIAVVGRVAGADLKLRV